MPSEVLIFDKEIHNFNDEVGRLYRTERVILKLDKDINNSKTNQMNRQKFSLQDSLKGEFETPDVSIEHAKFNNSRMTFKGKFLNMELNSSAFRRIETIILTFSKIELLPFTSNTPFEKEKGCILIKEDLSPEWKTVVLKKEQVKVADVMGKLNEILTESFIVDIKIRRTTVGKEEFTNIYYKSIARKRLNLSRVYAFQAPMEDRIVTSGFMIINSF